LTVLTPIGRGSPGASTASERFDSYVATVRREGAMRATVRTHSLIEAIMLVGYSLVAVVRDRLTTARRA
jgi:hypothetical protein